MTNVHTTVNTSQIQNWHIREKKAFCSRKKYSVLHKFGNENNMLWSLSRGEAQRSAPKMFMLTSTREELSSICQNRSQKDFATNAKTITFDCLQRYQKEHYGTFAFCTLFKLAQFRNSIFFLFSYVKCTKNPFAPVHKVLSQGF